MGLLREEMVCVLGGWREGCSTVNYSSKEKQSCQMLLMGLHCQSLINGKTILLMGNWAAYTERERERERERGVGSSCSIVNHSSKKKKQSCQMLVMGLLWGRMDVKREEGTEKDGCGTVHHSSMEKQSCWWVTGLLTDREGQLQHC